MLYIFQKKGTYGLGSSSKDRHRFVDAFALIFSSDWLNWLSDFEVSLRCNLNTALKRKTMVGFSKLHGDLTYA